MCVLSDLCPLDHNTLSMVVKNLAVSWHTFYYICIAVNVHIPSSSLHPPPPFPSSQIADQVGELLIHCRYGCKAQADNSEEYEVDPEGEYLMSCDVM